MPRFLASLTRALNPFLPVFLAVWLALIPTFVSAGSMGLLGVGGGSAALPGPPTFVYQASGSSTNVGAVVTSAALTVTATTANTRIYMTMTAPGMTGATTIASATIAGVTCDVTVNQNVGSNWTGLISATGFTPGTTSVTAVVTFGTAPVAQLPRFNAYEVDNTTLVSHAPVTPTGTINGSAITTLTVSTVTQANGGVLVAFSGFGISNGTQVMTADSTITQNTTFGPAATGVANNVPASAAYHVTETWTTAGSAVLGVFALR